MKKQSILMNYLSEKEITPKNANPQVVKSNPPAPAAKNIPVDNYASDYEDPYAVTDTQPIQQDPNGLPLPQDQQLEEPWSSTASYLGRVYELKKIYTKLLSLSDLLEHISDSKFDQVEQSIREAIDLYHIVVDNLEKFDDKVDDIVVNFYDFLKEILANIEELIKEKDRERDKE
jgi:hypothetical protein